MTIEDTTIVDFIGTDKENGAVGLLISDHLEWNSDKYPLLKDKINGYLDYIESGHLAAAYPDAATRSIYIELVYLEPPDEHGTRVLERIKEIAADSNVLFTWSQRVEPED